MTTEPLARTQRAATHSPHQAAKILTAGLSASLAIGLVTCIGASVKAEERRAAQQDATQAQGAAQAAAEQSAMGAPAVVFGPPAPITVPIVPVGEAAPAPVAPQVIAVNVPAPPPVATPARSTNSSATASSSSTTKASG